MMKSVTFILLTALAFSPTTLNSAYAIEAIELQVSRVGDLEMSCGTLSQEAVLMRDIIMTTQDIKSDSEMKSHGITAAGALGSFLVGTATGGVGIAAAGFFLDRANEKDASSADTVQDIAQQRRTLMMGIYNAKGCMGPLDHAMSDPEKTDDIIDMLASIEPASGNKESQYNQ